MAGVNDADAGLLWWSRLDDAVGRSVVLRGMVVVSDMGLAAVGGIAIVVSPDAGR